MALVASIENFLKRKLGPLPPCAPGAEPVEGLASCRPIGAGGRPQVGNRPAMARNRKLFAALDGAEDFRQTGLRFRRLDAAHLLILRSL